MDEITSAVRVANAAFKTVKIMDIAKKAVVVSAAVACCVFAAKYWRSR